MKILLVKTSSLGDIIQSFPVLSYLRQRFPNAQIDWVVEEPFAELVKAHPFVDHPILIKSKKWRKTWFSPATRNEVKKFYKSLKANYYDLVFDLQGNLKSSWVLMHVRAKEKVGFGWKAITEWPALFFTSKRVTPQKGQNIREDYLAVVQGYFKDQKLFQEEGSVTLRLEPEQLQWIETFFSNGPPPILVCPGAAWPTKRLPFESLLPVLKQLGRGPYLFAWGTGEEKKTAMELGLHFPESRLLDKQSLPVLQHIMTRCRLVVAMDSLPLHLCGTTKTPSLSFFGPSSALKYKPLGKQHRALQGTCPYGITFEKRCPKLRTCPTGACMKSAEHALTQLNLP